jgi:glutamyl-tRNA reductase
MQWLAQREAVPLIQRLNAQAESWRDIELERAKKALARGDDVNAVMEQLARGITQKALHGAYAHLNDASTPERVQAAAAVERLFLQRER